jgi:hypothetical protein
MAKPDEIGFNISGVAVTLTTTTQGVVVSSGPVKLPGRTAQVLVLAWAELTLGAATTTVIPRIRRGTAIGGALVGEGNAINNGVPAGETEAFFLMQAEERSNESSVEYSLTLQQTDATGNGTVLQAGIVVIVL